MSLTRQKILKIQITTSPREKILEYIRKYLSSPRQYGKKPMLIFTPNAEQIVLADKNIRFKEMLNQADVALPDGIGPVWAMRVLTPRMPIQRLSGVDFMEDLVALAAERSVRIGLIGGFDGLAVDALECLKAKYPRLSGWAADGPELELVGTTVGEQPAEAYWRQLAEKIEKDAVGMLFVGMGAPKQELVIKKIASVREELGFTASLVLMAVGGSFDFFAGRLKRAPLLIRSIGFEWFWRLLQEPWRWKRQLALWKFVGLVLREKVLAA